MAILPDFSIAPLSHVSNRPPPWSHAYVCPEHGMRLIQKAGQNLCPVDGKDYHGWPVDNVLYMQRNGGTAASARDLGLAFLLAGKKRFMRGRLGPLSETACP